MIYVGTVSKSNVNGAPEKYRVSLFDPCQKCGEKMLAPHPIRGGFLKLKIKEVGIKCKTCNYEQKDLSFLHMS
jgi:hypothetical protein